MLTIEQLLKRTHKDIVKRSSSYTYSEAELDTSRTRLRVHTGVVYGHGRKHVIKISIPGDKEELSSKAEVDCDCDYFKYHLEIPLAARKSAKVGRAEARMTLKTNPEFRPGLCVHLVSGFRALLDKSKKSNDNEGKQS